MPESSPMARRRDWDRPPVRHVRHAAERSARSGSSAAGHACVYTGSVPAVHGMVLNQWWERNNSRLVSCTDDDEKQLITYGVPVKGLHTIVWSIAGVRPTRDHHAAKITTDRPIAATPGNCELRIGGTARRIE